MIVHSEWLSDSAIFDRIFDRDLGSRDSYVLIVRMGRSLNTLSGKSARICCTQFFDTTQTSNIIENLQHRYRF